MRWWICSVLLCAGVVAGGIGGWMARDSVVSVPSPSSLAGLPVVVFEREGLLWARDRQLLYNRVIEPYIDYYAAMESRLLTITITVPAQSGEHFGMNTVFDSGVHEGMLIGVRDGDIPLWLPSCMGGCLFSDAFRAKHPDVVAQAESYFER